jgi:hypothetical protein
VEKVITLLWGPGDAAAGDALRARLLDEAVPRLRDAGARGIGINVHDSDADHAPSPAPPPAGEEPHVAEVSCWLDCYERRDGAEAALADWPDGVRSPGVLTVALIHRPDGLDSREWIDRWHGTQSPVSGELQPRTRYVRNQVVRALTEGAPEIDGIVEEGWPSAEHVADPMLFFNATTPAELDAHVARMMTSVDACLDLARLRSSTMSEYLVSALA